MKRNFMLVAMAAVAMVFATSCKNDDPVEEGYKLPEGALSGKFSVSPTKQVQFSKGNLQATYEGDKYVWAFAENQYDFVDGKSGNVCIGNPTEGAKIDLFGWSTATSNFGICASTDNADYSGDFVDWGKTIDNKGSWRTLTGGQGGEWQYLLSGRPNAENLYRLEVSVCNKMFNLVIAPDDFEGTIERRYDAESWAEAEAAGLVCLPAAGDRVSATSVDNGETVGHYWASTLTDKGIPSYMRFDDWEFNDLDQMANRWYGLSVRLVTDVPEETEE